MHVLQGLHATNLFVISPLQSFAHQLNVPITHPITYDRCLQQVCQDIMGPKAGQAKDQGSNDRFGSIQIDGGEEKASGSHQEGTEKVDQ